MASKAALNKYLVKKVKSMAECNKTRQKMERLREESFVYVTETEKPDGAKTAVVKLPEFKHSQVTFHVESHTTVHVYAEKHDGPAVRERYAQVVFPTVVDHKQISVKSSGDITVEVPGDITVEVPPPKKK